MNGVLMILSQFQRILCQENQVLPKVTHCFFTIMNIKRKGTFQFCFTGYSKYSKEPKLKRIFEMLWVLFEKILSLYFGWLKSWTWRTLGHVLDTFRIWHFHNASKEVFWPNFFLNFKHGFKSAISILAKFWDFTGMLLKTPYLWNPSWPTGPIFLWEKRLTL